MGYDGQMSGAACKARKLLDPSVGELVTNYGMVGRLLSQEPEGKMPLTEQQARSIAEQAVKTAGTGLALDGGTATFYGFYEFSASQQGKAVGELDVNGYSGQAWYKEWGEPQISVQDLSAGR